MFVDSQFTLDYDNQMTKKYFAAYTGIKVKQFRETLLQHMSNVKKFVAERTRHKRLYDRRMNKRQMQTQKSKVDLGKQLDTSLVVTKSSGIESRNQDTSSKSGNDADVDNADIKPIYDEELMAEVQLTAEYNLFATGQQHTEQLEIITKGRVNQYTKQRQVKSPMPDSSFDNKTTKFSNHSLEYERQHGQILNKTSNKAKIKHDIDEIETINIKLEHSMATLLKENESLKKHYKDFQEKVFAIASLKNDLRKLKENSVDTKFAKTSVLGKPVLQSLINQSVVRQPNAFKSKRPQMSKPQFSSQVDMNNNLSKPVTQHYFAKKRASAFAKADSMIASSSSRNSSKNMPRFSSNDMVHNYYLEEVKKKTQERNRNSKYNVMHTASPQNTTKGMSFDSCMGKADSEPPHGSNRDISKIHECKQTLDLSAELESLFGHLFNEYINGENQVVSMSFIVTTVDSSDKRQQQPDSTSSTSTLATTVTTDGNFDLVAVSSSLRLLKPKCTNRV
nr:hypothetical protein [Tanacetum cinerariifolium]